MKHDENLCAEIQSTLPLYVGGDLEAQALTEVRTHLVACPACAERALAARAARRELVAALRIDSRPGPDLWAGVRAALVEEGALHVAAAPRASQTARRRSLGFALAAAAAAVVVSFWVGARWKDAQAPRPDGGSPPIARQERLVPPPEPLAPEAGPRAALAESNDTGLAGLRRLAPGERPLRDHALPILDSGALIQVVPVQREPGVQPVGLRHVGANAPRW
ncbi:MAG: zf-HC2 domain-containing protein [Planctomycetes bacterium]|nr:zf-HC2 domain-containing protein [Planctomycetota bacterium]